MADPDFRDLFLTATALLSPQQKPPQNWENAVLAMRSWTQTGKLEFRKPDGKMFGVNEKGLRLLQHLIDTIGLEAAMDWVKTPQTPMAMAQMRMESGLFAPKDPKTGEVSTRPIHYMPSEITSKSAIFL